ncbi:hypothetical protein LAZ67_X002349 [Cordylochernes scorpioides]|uniref:DUF5641 domain-containing protein n=1 Tax=Cordylochernes scorpioides TaxID=51811 RepID=A0ABY6LY73_9ARAC|nr:hypothetical protein LAZ67_X002349 [Cordylochernes scorpioides]
MKTRPGRDSQKLEEGDFVLIGPDQYRLLQWPLARILELYPGRDRKERVALVKTQEGEYVRPVQRLYKLEIDKDIANEIRISSRGRYLHQLKKKTKKKLIYLNICK